MLEEIGDGSIQALDDRDTLPVSTPQAYGIKTKAFDSDPIVRRSQTCCCRCCGCCTGTMYLIALVFGDRWPYLLFVKQVISSLGLDPITTYLFWVVGGIIFLDLAFCMIFYFIYFCRHFHRPMIFLLRWDLLHHHRLHQWYFCTVVVLITLISIIAFGIGLSAKPWDEIKESSLIGSYNNFLLNSTGWYRGWTLHEPAVSTFTGKVIPAGKNILLFLIAGFKMFFAQFMYKGPTSERHIRNLRKFEKEKRMDSLPRPHIGCCDVCCSPTRHTLRSLIQPLLFINSSSDWDVLANKRPSLRHYNWGMLKGLSTDELFRLKMFFFSFFDDRKPSFWHDDIVIFKHIYLKCKKSKPIDGGGGGTKAGGGGGGAENIRASEKVTEVEKAVLRKTIQDVIDPQHAIPVEMIGSVAAGTEFRGEGAVRVSQHPLELDLTGEDIEIPGEFEEEEEELVGDEDDGFEAVAVEMPDAADDGKDDDESSSEDEGEGEGEVEMKAVAGKSDGDGDAVEKPSGKCACCKPLIDFIKKMFVTPVTNHFFGFVWVCYLVFRRQLTELLLFLLLVSFTSWYCAPVILVVLIEGIILVVYYMVKYGKDADNTLKILINFELLRESRIIKWFSSMAEKVGIAELPPDCKWWSSAPPDPVEGVHFVTFVSFLAMAGLPVHSGVTTCYRFFEGSFIYYKGMNFMRSTIEATVVAFIILLIGIQSYNSPSCLRYSDQLLDLQEKLAAFKAKAEAEAEGEEGEGESKAISVKEKPFSIPNLRYGIINHIIGNTEYMLQETLILLLFVNVPSDVELYSKLPSFATFPFPWVRDLSEDELYSLKRFFFPFFFTDDFESPSFCREYWYDIDPAFCCLCCTCVKCCRYCREKREAEAKAVVPV